MKDIRAYEILMKSKLWENAKYCPDSELSQAIETALMALREKIDSCNQNVKEHWYFTFGLGSQRPYNYVKIYGTYDDARDEMFKRYGKDWAFQYDERSWKRSYCSQRYTELKPESHTLKVPK